MLRGRLLEDWERIMGQKYSLLWTPLFYSNNVNRLELHPKFMGYVQLCKSQIYFAISLNAMFLIYGVWMLDSKFSLSSSSSIQQNNKGGWLCNFFNKILWSKCILPKLNPSSSYIHLVNKLILSIFLNKTNKLIIHGIFLFIKTNKLLYLNEIDLWTIQGIRGQLHLFHRLHRIYFKYQNLWMALGEHIFAPKLRDNQ